MKLRLFVLMVIVVGSVKVYRSCGSAPSALDNEQRKLLNAIANVNTLTHREPLLAQGTKGNAIDDYLAAMKLANINKDDTSPARDKKVAELVLKGASRTFRDGSVIKPGVHTWPRMLAVPKAVDRAAALERAQGNSAKALTYVLASHRMWQDLTHTGAVVYASIGIARDKAAIALVRDMVAKGELTAAERTSAARVYARLARTRPRAAQIVRNELAAFAEVVLAADAHGKSADPIALIGGVQAAADRHGGGLGGLAEVTIRLNWLLREAPHGDALSSYRWSRSVVSGCARLLGRARFCDRLGDAMVGNQIRNTEFRVLAAELR